ncbi:MAG: hypothetical protein D6714_12225 [Bacteroidetes bacterium]|nr:MAG: hypothetical protein D6714_12225 [Bacteroidota bacterium]
MPVRVYRILRIWIFAFLGLAGTPQMTGQTDNATFSAPETTSLGNPASLSENTAALFGNPAGLTTNVAPAMTAHHVNYFLLNELTRSAVGGVFPTRSGIFGVVFHQYGIESFREQKIGLSYARKFSNVLSGGVQFNYFNVRAKEYGHAGQGGVEGGLTAKISSNWRMGLHFFSPVATGSSLRQDHPAFLKFGMAFGLNPKVDVLVEIEKDLPHPARLHFGSAYRPHKKLTVRVGLQTNPGIFHFGFGSVLWEYFELNASASYHPTLGLSPGLGLNYKFKQ